MRLIQINVDDSAPFRPVATAGLYFGSGSTSDIDVFDLGGEAYAMVPLNRVIQTFRVSSSAISGSVDQATASPSPPTP